MKYLLKFTPLEPYFFGDENTIRIGEKNRYYVTSFKVPSITTIIGTLRYIILQQSGLLMTNGRYTTDDELKKITELIGERTFSPAAENPDMGCIKEVSPLFIISEDGEEYFRLPLNHCPDASEEYYTPLIMQSAAVETSYGNIILPENFNAKKPAPGDAFFNIKTGEILPRYDKEKKKMKQIFKRFTKVTINNSAVKEAYVKKDFYILEKGFSFAVISEIDGAALGSTICYMGREKAAFRLDAVEVEPDYSEALFGNIGDSDNAVYYAAGDIILKCPPRYHSYSMVTTRTLRALSTELNASGSRVVRSPKLYNVIRAGSVFYPYNGGCPLIDEAEGSNRFGYNKIIKVGAIKK